LLLSLQLLSVFRFHLRSLAQLHLSLARPTPVLCTGFPRSTSFPELHPKPSLTTTSSTRYNHPPCPNIAFLHNLDSPFCFSLLGPARGEAIGCRSFSESLSAPSFFSPRADGGTVFGPPERLWSCPQGHRPSSFYLTFGPLTAFATSLPVCNNVAAIGPRRRSPSPFDVTSAESRPVRIP